MTSSHRRLAAVAAGLATVAAGAVGVPAAQAAPVSSPWSGSARADVVTLGVDLANTDLADVAVGRSRALVDSTLPAGNSTASSSNLALALAGFPVPVQQTTATAPPSRTADGVVPAGSIPGVLSLGLLRSTASAAWSTGNTCVPAVGGVRELSRATTSLASADVVTLPLLGTLASLGASTTTTTTRLVETGSTSRVETRATSQIGDLSLLGGQVRVRVADPVVATATSDGATGAFAYDAPTVTVELAGAPGTLIDLSQQVGQTFSRSIGLATVTVSLGDAQDTSAGATGTGSVPAVLDVSVDVLPVLGASAASVDLAVSPLSATATAPTGGVQCPAPVEPDRDGDGLTDVQETSGSANTRYGGTPTDPDDSDSDDDGVLDGPEIGLGTNPNAADTDTDGISDGDEVTGSRNTFTPVPTDPLDADSDDDGLTDGQEVTGSRNTAHGNEPTNPNSADTDADGSGDGVEVVAGTDPNDPRSPGTPVADSDNDGLPDDVETSGSANTGYGMAPTDPRDSDSDDDGVLDGTETVIGTDPNASDTDGDDDSDGEETSGSANVAFDRRPTDPRDPDTDDDGLTDGQETSGSANTAFGRAPTDPHAADTDRDGLSDRAETTGRSNPNDPASPSTAPLPPVGPAGPTDTDGDGLPDSTETTIGTDPRRSDTDADGLADGLEVSGAANQKYGGQATNPLNPDTDGDGRSDLAEVTRKKMRQRVYKQGRKPQRIGFVRTDPNRADTDKDGLTDGQEVAGFTLPTRVVLKSGAIIKIKKVRTNALKKDTDKDGLRDGAEVRGTRNKKFGGAASNPLHWNTDRAGPGDGAEVRRGGDPVRARR